MKSSVIIHSDLQRDPFVEKIAVGIALFHDTGRYPDFLGHYGQFENNPQAMDSLINKIHIALYREEWTLRTWRHRNGYNRTSDNFVIYARHFFFSNHYLILNIVSPNAHKEIQRLLPNLINKAESFHRLTLEEISQFTAYTSNHEITRTIRLTD
ncbi:type II toxin-antitoxin system YafO family toxin [Pasteurellaceae bacterium 20609_3]|uniref:type II toxin-antitoxin system YafO family toxin n=1 Tax=Spirabiliibacterium mucosae TaxID=28156 RepID=UPI001AAE0A65|nr:type II toxin-antitoxin system YafO family toxin [Spirabiliibacterium mucosae]MBE2899020.1 type II toxin-antitoxin system YafO family toxin [Spirabiliibacterium mucosae]